MPSTTRKPDDGINRLRIGRRSITNQMYHVTTVTAARDKIFSNVLLGRLLVRSLIRLDHSKKAKTMAFVIMPDHLHWLFQLPEDSDLSRTVGSLKSQSSRSIKSILGRSKPVWCRGFHDRAVRKDDDIVHIARYIVANPLRAGLVKCVGDYPLWDSIWV